MEATLVPAIGDNISKVPLAEVLSEQYEALIDRLHDLAANAEAVPLPVKDDTSLTKLGNVVKEAVGIGKALESARVAAKEPYLKGGREVDGFFGRLDKELADAVKPLRDAATDYQRAKAAEERRQREEAARRAREEERRAREAAEAAAAAAAAATRRATEERRLEEASRANTQADLAAATAQEREVEAGASAAEMTRARSDEGTLVTTVTTWGFRIEDLAAVPLETLRPFIKREHIEQSIRAFVRIHKGDAVLAGVVIYPEENAAFR